MLFRLLAVLSLVHGVFGLLVAKLRSMPVVHDLVNGFLPDTVLNAINQAYPDRLYQPYQGGTADIIPTPERGYGISLAQIAVSTWYLVFGCDTRQR